MRAILVAGGLGMFFTLFATPAFIWLFKKLQWGQFIRDDGPQSHHTKRGTPTMGGIVIITGSLIGYFVAKIGYFVVKIGHCVAKIGYFEAKIGCL